MTSQPPQHRCNGELSLVRTMTTSVRPVQADEFGDIVVPLNYKEEILDFEGSSIWCSEHGRLGTEQYDAHGISDCWEEK